MSEENNSIPLKIESYRKTYWHTCSHVLAQAVKRLYPEVKLAIGPSIDDGFYYDMDSPFPFTPEIMEKIEGEMRKICKEKLKLERFELPREEAIKFMEEKGEPYKVELINDLPEDAHISFYKQGEFTDLCAGPHLDSTGRIKGNAIKLTACNAAYWRGDSNRQTLQRIYGIAFPKKEELDAYLPAHRGGQEAGPPQAGQGAGPVHARGRGPRLPLLPAQGHGAEEHPDRLLAPDPQEVRLCGDLHPHDPQPASCGSGPATGITTSRTCTPPSSTSEDYAIKPMNCPGGMLVYNSEPHSYRDLPLRVGELGLVHRHELSGALHGLFRVRCFTQDDAHIFMTREQMKDVIQETVRLFDEVYSTFGLSYTIELSTMPEDHIGDEKDVGVRPGYPASNAITEMGKDVQSSTRATAPSTAPSWTSIWPIPWAGPGSAAPSSWTCQLPERFELEYTGEDGQKHRPVMIHRVVLGSIERFIGVITEHFAGAFPAWLSPVQVKVLPITDRAGGLCRRGGRQAGRRRLPGGSGRPQREDRQEDPRGHRWRRSPICWWWATGIWRTALSPSALRSGEDLGAMCLGRLPAPCCKEVVDTKALK